MDQHTPPKWLALMLLVVLVFFSTLGIISLAHIITLSMR